MCCFLEFIAGSAALLSSAPHRIFLALCARCFAFVLILNYLQLARLWDHNIYIKIINYITVLLLFWVQYPFKLFYNLDFYETHF